MKETLITKFNPGTNYSVIPNDLFKLGLSLQAIGIAIYINHLPTDWVLTTLELCERFDLAPNTVNKYIRELRDAGVVEIIHKRSEDGLITGIRKWILRIPEPEQPRTDGGRNLKQENAVRWQNLVGAGYDPRKGVPQAMPTLTQKLHTTKETVQKKHEETKNAHARTHVCEVVKRLAYKKGMSVPQKKRAFYDALKEKIATVFKTSSKPLESPFSPQELQAIERFIAHRQQTRPVSYEQKRALQRHLLELKKEGEDICACIETSIRRGFNDVFPPKNPSKATSKSFLDRLLGQHKELGLNTQNIEEVISNALDTFSHLIGTYRGLSLENIHRNTLKAYKACEVKG